MVKKNLWIAALLALIAAGCSSSQTTADQSKDNAPSGNGTTPASGSGTTPTAGGMNPPTINGSKTIAFVTNNPSDYWTIARKGFDKAAAELKDFKLEFKIPGTGAAAEQKQILQDLVTEKIGGIAVSPVAPKDQTDDLNDVASKTLLVTQDSDAPDSKRCFYIGTDNVAAGTMAGGEVKKALPGGGKIMVFVGKADAQNAKERYQGLQDALKGSNISIIDLKTDDTDHARAKQNVADAITAYPDLAGCVGLWSYNGPAIYNAVKEANKVGKIKIVCFDEEDDTLAGIRDGAITSTIVQNPYEFGYESMIMMAKIINGDKSGIPPDGKKIIPTRVIDKSTVDKFAADLKVLRGK